MGGRLVGNLREEFVGTGSVIEMQSEGGVAGVIHGALQTGAQLGPVVAGMPADGPEHGHIAGDSRDRFSHRGPLARGTALSIFGVDSDVMAARATGWAMLCSASVQEARNWR